MGAPSFSGRGVGSQDRARGRHLTAMNMLSAFSGFNQRGVCCLSAFGQFNQRLGGGGGGGCCPLLAD